MGTDVELVETVKPSPGSARSYLVRELMQIAQGKGLDAEREINARKIRSQVGETVTEKLKLTGRFFVFVVEVDSTFTDEIVTSATTTHRVTGRVADLLKICETERMPVDRFIAGVVESMMLGERYAKGVKTVYNKVGILVPVDDETVNI